jgi:hypothetical protein
MLPRVQTAAGMALIVVGSAVALSLVTWMRDRVAGRAADVLAALAGVSVACGGLLLIGGANVWSWVVAASVLGTGAVAQRKALLAPGGPFRT